MATYGHQGGYAFNEDQREAMRDEARAAALAKLLEPQSTEFWGAVCFFKPVVLDKVYGDGEQLVQLFPINERPRYWVVRIDAKCDREGLCDILDDIYDAIDEQFGRPPDEDRGFGDERPYFPSYDSEGMSWHFVR